MEENTFASFVPITAFDGQDTEELKKYYTDNRLTPENDQLKKYLNWPAESVVPSSVSTPNPSLPAKFDIGKLLGNLTYTSTTPAAKTEESTSKAPTISTQTAAKDPKDFLQKYGESARLASQESGFSEDLLLAQMALETGWGKHAPGYNFGGVKPGKSWKGKTQTLMTKEFENGKYVRKPQTFRAYDSAEEGFKGYVDFLSTNKRYGGLKGVTDPFEAADLMGKTGYATDPNYTTSLKNVMKQIQAARS